MIFLMCKPEKNVVYKWNIECTFLWLMIILGFINRIIVRKIYFPLLPRNLVCMLETKIKCKFQLSYICSRTRYTKCFNEWVYSALKFSSTCFGPHRSIIRSVLYKLYSQIWYVVIRVLLDTSSRYEVTISSPVVLFTKAVSLMKIVELNQWIVKPFPSACTFHIKNNTF